MNLRWIRTFICCGALMMALCNVGQAGDSWFGSSKAPAANGVTTNSKKSWWPSWPTSTKSKPKPTASKSTSMWSSVTKGTKNTWNKTTSFLNPFDNKPTKTTTNSSATASDSAANSSGWFGTKKTKTEEVATLHDFLGQEKPKW